MVSFSICLICRNAEKTLPRLIKSLGEFQRRDGEVVLVDTGSTDRSIEVARNAGFSVHPVGNRFLFELPADLVGEINKKFVVEGDQPVVQTGDKLFNYSDARNYSVSKASNDVVSCPDADEQFTSLDIDAIERKIREGFEQFEFHFIFAHDHLGRPAVQFRQCKMFNRKKMKWQGIIHEVLVGEARRTYLPPNVLLLEHFQLPDNTPHRNRYLCGLALDCFQNPEADRQSHYLARELMWSGRPKSAIREFDRHILMNRWAQERGQSLVFRGDCFLTIGDEEEALASWHRAITADGTRREPWLRLADFYWKRNDPQKTSSYIAAALEIPPNDCYCNQQSHYTNYPHELMYWALWWMGQRERSKEHWRKAFAYDPSNPKYIADKQFYEPTSYDYKLPGGGGAAEGAGIDGWMTHGELEWLYHQAQKVDSILELGSWKGRSTHALLSGCKGTVTAVDTWKGSADPRDMTNAQAKQMDILAEFKKNVGHFKNLEIVQMDSADAAAKFREEGRKFDMVFIDAGHTYEEVKRDIEMWRPFAKVILSGHDYLPQTWMGVCQAVDECCGRTYKAESIWYTPAEPFPQIKGKYFDSRLSMQEKIEVFEPFSYVKWNDGEQQCIEGVEGATCDGQPYSYELNLALRKAYNFLVTLPDVYISDWKEWRDDNLNDGGILLHREKRDLQPLHDFYMAIKRSPRRKIFVGPEKLCTQVGRLLDCNYIEVPEKDAFAKYDDILARLKSITTDLSIIMLSCGLISKPLIADILKHNPKVTCLDTGSSFDPIFLGATRTLQAPQKDLLALYADMLGNEGLEKGEGCGLPTITSFPQRIPKSIFTIWLSEKEGLPPIVEKCVETQKAVEGYEHRVLTLADVPKDIPYLDAALAAKKWVKAADYLRIWWLKEHGGIYCDSDMEILPGKNFDALLDSSLFICREENGFVANSLIGAEPGNQVCIEHLSEVESRFKGDDDNIFQAAQEILTPRVLNASTLNPSIKVLSADYFIPYNHQNGTIKVTENTIAFHHFVKAWITESYTKDFLPRIAILIPHVRDTRDKGLKRLLDSIDRLYYPKHLITVKIDDDPSPSVPQKVNKILYEALTDQAAEAFIYAADDMEFDPWCVYRAVQDARGNPSNPHPFEVPPAIPFLHGLISFNAGPVYPDEGNICEHFLITRELVEKFGEIFSLKFHHVGCDNLLWAKAKKIQQAYHSETAKVIHHHFTKGAPMDEIYQRGWSQVDQDREVLARELENLQD